MALQTRCSTRSSLGSAAARLLVAAGLGVSCGAEDVVIGADPAPDASVTDATTAHDASTDRAGSGDAAVDATASDAGDGGTAGQDASVSDGATDGAPLDDGAITNPLMVPGLVLWLEASQGVTQNGTGVTRWADQTAFHNDATAAAGQEPTLVASAINGLPALHFDRGVDSGTGDELTIADSASLQFATSDFFVALVTSFDDDPANGDGTGVALFYTKQPPGFAVAAPFLCGNFPSFIAANQVGLVFFTDMSGGNIVVNDTAYNDGTPHVFSMSRVGLDIALGVDHTGGGRTVPSAQDVSSPGNPVQIGGFQGAQTLRLDGHVAEVLAVAGPSVGPNTGGLTHYLLTKYGLWPDGG